MVSMRDGVRLATDVYRPRDANGNGPAGGLAAILIRTSIGKQHPEWQPQIDFFPHRGYALVIQDIRSRGDSEGDGRYYHARNPWEGRDGYDTVEWIAAQEWSNGRVGMMGSSHRAIVQTQAALDRPPHLAAICPEQGPTNIYAHESREGGAMALHMYTAAYFHGLDAQEIRDKPDAVRTLVNGLVHTREWLRRMPFERGKIPLSAAPYLEETFFNYYFRGEYDDWWARDCCDQTTRWDRHADIPCFITGGWFDAFVDGSTGYFEAMVSRNSVPSRLIVGPWGHGTMRTNTTALGDVDFGPDAMWGYPKHSEERLRWFDRWLREVSNGAEDDPPVEIFVMGGGSGRQTPEGLLDHGGRWRAESEWPIARTQYRTLYMTPELGLNEAQPPAHTPPLSFEYDPEDPVPTAGGSLCSLLEIVPPPEGLPDVPEYGQRADTYGAFLRPVVPWGPWHQVEGESMLGVSPPYRLLCDRSDVLAFQTEPLREDIEVTGRVVVNLWISSTGRDTDFTVKLVDVYPPGKDYTQGYHMNLCDTILRCRYRDSWTESRLMTPGQAYALTIPLPATSNLFKAGHRIRVDVSSSNFPRFDVNPNTGEPVGRHTRMVVVENTVYVDTARPSHIVLPVIPGA